MVTDEDLRQALECFEVKDGRVRLKSNSPPWLWNLARRVSDTHDPYRLAFLRSSLRTILAEDPLSDVESAIFQLGPDKFTQHLFNWVASSPRRIAYVDQAVEDQGWPQLGLEKALLMGLELEMSEVADIVMGFLREDHGGE